MQLSKVVLALLIKCHKYRVYNTFFFFFYRKKEYDIMNI